MNGIPRYWVSTVSREHVLRGVAGGFCQVCHGKAAPLRRMKPGDWLVYYSSKESIEGNEPCQAFTGIGRIVDGPVYEFAMTPSFVPFRRDVAFIQTAVDAPIRPLIDRLSFLPDKLRWGYPFRFGHFEIGQEDFALIAEAMGVALSSVEAAA